VRLPVVLIPLALAVVATIASAQPGQPASLPGEPVFVVSGRGWGHGVGMSQWGAYGQALVGRGHEEILAHYYPGTELGRAGTRQVRVLLAEGRRGVTVSSTSPLTAVDASGEKYRLAARPLQLGRRLVLLLETGRVRAISPLVLRSRKDAPLSLDGKLYRGSFEVTVEKGFLRVVNVVPLESYLEGVVAGEMPHTWPSEALRAQAVAARSYALATRVKGKPFDHYSDVRSQVYLGVEGEKPRTTEAVRATAGQVLLYGGQVATTYYFSTSGGRTASAEDVFGFSTPYLVSRPDPWDKASPYHRWGPFVLPGSELQSKLDLEARVLDAVGVATPSGRLRSLRVQTADGTTTVPAALLRTGLGLRSTWATIGVLRLDQPAEPMVFGSTLRLAGIARGLSAPALSSSGDLGGSWSKVGRLERGSNGAASIAVSPTRTTRYRIEAEKFASPEIAVEVAPRVELQPPSEPRTLSGIVRPRLRGARVTIERRRSADWAPVVKTTVDEAGAFRARLALVPGSYRARVAETGTWAEGVAPVLVVNG
jgi:stage II sporulation protein D